VCPQSAVFVFCHVQGQYIPPRCNEADRGGAPTSSDGMCPFFSSRAIARGGGCAVPVSMMLTDAGRMTDATLNIEALGIAVKKMRAGERVKVVASSAYAFGAEGGNASSDVGWLIARVPANVSVVLEIELLRFGEQDVLRDGLGSLLVSYLRDWPSLACPTGFSLSIAGDVVGGAGCAKKPAPWRRVRRGSGWRTAFSGGQVRKVEVVVKFVARDAQGRILDWSRRGPCSCKPAECRTGGRDCVCGGGGAADPCKAKVEAVCYTLVRELIPPPPEEEEEPEVYTAWGAEDDEEETMRKGGEEKEGPMPAVSAEQQGGYARELDLTPHMRQIDARQGLAAAAAAAAPPPSSLPVPPRQPPAPRPVMPAQPAGSSYGRSCGISK